MNTAPYGTRQDSLDLNHKQWYALYVRCNHEKNVAHSLSSRGVEYFLPCYKSLRRWKDRRVMLELPLFPGYVLVRLPLLERAKVLLVPNVVSLVGSNDSGSSKVTLSGVADLKNANTARHPLLRRWDQKAGDSAEGGLTLGSDNAALIQESSNGNWLVLEDGVQIQFQPPVPGRQPNQYRTGDYWLIPARTATGDVEWPRETIKDSSGANLIVPIAKFPDGIQHHYALLAVVNVSTSGTFVVKPDCHKTIQPPISSGSSS